MSSNGEQMADGTTRQKDDATERESATKVGTEAKTQVEKELEATRIQTDTGKIGGHTKDNLIGQSFFPRNEEGAVASRPFRMFLLCEIMLSVMFDSPKANQILGRRWNRRSGGQATCTDTGIFKTKIRNTH